MTRLAFFTFGILQEEFGHPRLRAFEELDDIVFATAEGAPGFIQLVDWVDGVRQPRFTRPGRNEGAQTLSVWADLASVYAFAYRGSHAEALRRRKEWFVKPQWPTYVAWWVADDQLPAWSEGAERLENLHDHGPTPYAFDFKTPFDANGQHVDAPGVRRASAE